MRWSARRSALASFVIVRVLVVVCLVGVWTGVVSLGDEQVCPEPN